MPAPGPGARVKQAFTRAAPRLAATSTALSGITSSRLVSAATSDPVTKPSWTEIVSHDAAPGLRCHASRSGRTTAVPANQVLMASKVARAIHSSARQRPAASAGPASTAAVPRRSPGATPTPASPALVSVTVEELQEVLDRVLEPDVVSGPLGEEPLVLEHPAI